MGGYAENNNGYHEEHKQPVEFRLEIACVPPEELVNNGYQQFGNKSSYPWIGNRGSTRSAKFRYNTTIDTVNPRCVISLPNAATTLIIAVTLNQSNEHQSASRVGDKTFTTTRPVTKKATIHIETLVLKYKSIV